MILSEDEGKTPSWVFWVLMTINLPTGSLRPEEQFEKWMAMLRMMAADNDDAYGITPAFILEQVGTRPSGPAQKQTH